MNRKDRSRRMNQSKDDRRSDITRRTSPYPRGQCPNRPSQCYAHSLDAGRSKSHSRKITKKYHQYTCRDPFSKIGTRKYAYTSRTNMSKKSPRRGDSDGIE